MELQEVIASLPDWSNKTVNQLLSLLNEPSIVVTLPTPGIETVVSPVEKAGLPPATLSEVLEAIALLNLQEEKKQMRETAADRYNNYIVAVDNYNEGGELPVL